MGVISTKLLAPQDIMAVVQAVGVDELMDSLIARLETSFLQFDSTKILTPKRSGFNYTYPKTGLLEWMPILELGSKMLMKMVGYHPRNPLESELPTILSNFSLYDATTGQVLAILDGTFLTAFRTGAASAIASRLLAKSDCRDVGLIGCGAQAVTQLHALSRVFDIQTVKYFDIDDLASQSFQERCWFLGAEVRFQESRREQIISKSDIVSVATSVEVGAGPVFAGTETRSHLHINAVGSDFPGKTELPLSLLKRSHVIPDCLEQAMIEGECQQLSRKHVSKPLAEMMNAPTDLKDELTVFDSTGWALEDYVATQLFLEHADDLGIGQLIETCPRNIDPKNPYESLLNRFPSKLARRPVILKR